jgi:hypothetical protein
MARCRRTLIRVGDSERKEKHMNGALVSRALVGAASALVCGAFLGAPPAAAQEPIFVEPAVVAVAPASVGVDPHELKPPASTEMIPIDGGGGALAGGCWTAVGGYVYGSDWFHPGRWEWHYEPSWCGNGMYVTHILDHKVWPVVEGWYEFRGFDGVFEQDGCVSDPGRCHYVRFLSRARFSWSTPAGIYTHNQSVRFGLHLTGAGFVWIYDWCC